VLAEGRRKVSEVAREAAVAAQGVALCWWRLRRSGLLIREQIKIISILEEIDGSRSLKQIVKIGVGIGLRNGSGFVRMLVAILMIIDIISATLNFISFQTSQQ
jgi:hypothetical protein